MGNHFARAISVFLILGAFWLAVHTAVTKGPTFDEQGFIVRGVTYLRGELRTMRVGHPLGLNGWNGVLAANDPQINSPLLDSSWNGRDFHQPAEIFMWESGNSVEKILFLTRIQTVWLFLILGVMVSRWVGQLTGRGDLAVYALIFTLFDPNLLAHGALATTDLGLTVGAIISAYTLWLAWRKPGLFTVALAGVGLALLNNTKFTAGIFVVIFAAVIVVLLASESIKDGLPAVWQRRRTLLVGVPLVGFVALWGMYGFQIGRMPDSLPMAQHLSGLTLPLSHHLEQLLDIGNRAGKGAPAFLLGELREDGWWTYFLVALAIKTPLPTMVLWGAGIVSWILWKRRSPNRVGAGLFFIGPPIGFLLFSMTTSVNIGFRHIMPITPFLLVWALSGIGASKKEKLIVGREKLKVERSHPEDGPESLARGLSFTKPFTNRPLNFNLLTLNSFLSIWLLIITIWISPHALAFFNVVGGGPANGWLYLVDSNIDWGQDLVTLDRWLEENRPDERAYLSYFGEARPEYYDIRYQGLASFPPRLMTPAADPIIPQRPVAGLYAISVTNLQGVHFSDPALLSWFRPKEPLVRLGYSINLYEVLPTGEPLAVALGGGVQPAAIPGKLLDRWGTNQLDFRWFGRGGWVVPAEQNGIVIIPDALVGTAPPCLSWMAITDWPGHLQSNSAPCQRDQTPLTERFALEDSGLTLLSAEVADRPAPESADQTVDITTWWRHEGTVTPRKIFIHLIDQNDEIVAQWDGWDIPAAGWQNGDLFFFHHAISLPNSQSFPEDNLDVWIGVYDPADGRRWSLPDGAERLFLAQVGVEER